MSLNSSHFRRQQCHLRSVAVGHLFSGHISGSSNRFEKLWNSFSLFINETVIKSRPCKRGCLSHWLSSTKGRGKGKGNPRTDHKATEREYNSTLSLISTLDGVGEHRHAPNYWRPRKTRYPLYRRLVGRQIRSGNARKISPTSGFYPRTVQLIASRCTDCAILGLSSTTWLKLPTLFFRSWCVMSGQLGG